MNKRFFVLILFIIPIILRSQGEIDTEQKIFYRNEKTMALLLSTNGFGFDFSYAKRLDGYKKILYQIDIVEIKHPKEVKFSYASSLFQTSSGFVYGKLNKFFDLRIGTGLQKEIYRKIDRGGVSIRKNFTLGADIGFEKPQYYVMVDYISGITEVRTTRKFDVSNHSSNNIERNASFFMGFREIRVTPGAFAKYSFTFEFGKYDEVINAIEGGIVVDAFPRPIKLMAFNNHDFIFVSLYLSYRFGKVIDSRFKTRKNKIDKIISNQAN